MNQMMKNKKAIAVLLLAAMLFSILPTAVWAASDSVPFTATVDGTEILVELSEDTYTHINWDGTTGSTVQLYVAYIPKDAEVVTLDFGNEKVLVYGYDTNDNSSTYIAAYDEYEDIMVGSSSALVTEENFGYYAEVQTPYDENWANELLYAVAFEYEKIDEVPFSVEAAGIKLDAKLLEEYYKKHPEERPVEEAPAPVEPTEKDYLREIAHSLKCRGRAGRRHF